MHLNAFSEDPKFYYAAISGRYLINRIRISRWTVGDIIRQTILYGTSTLINYSICLSLRKRGFIIISKLLENRNKGRKNNVKCVKRAKKYYFAWLRGKEVYVWIERLEGESRDSRWLEWKSRLSLCLTIYTLVSLILVTSYTSCRYYRTWLAPLSCASNISPTFLAFLSSKRFI